MILLVFGMKAHLCPHIQLKWHYLKGLTFDIEAKNSLFSSPTSNQPYLLFWFDSNGTSSSKAFRNFSPLIKPILVFDTKAKALILFCFRITIKDERLLTYYCKQKKRFFKRLDFCYRRQQQSVFVRPSSTAPHT